MAASPAHSGNVRVEEILSKTREIAVLPHVVFKIMEMTGADDSSAIALERAIVVDPGFSVKILTQANSAHFALPKKVTSIREAVMFVGLKSVRQLAMTVGVFDMFVGKTDKESMRRRFWWRQSVDTAVCARALAEKTPLVHADDAYTAGLLHLIGRTIIDRSNPKEYEKVELLVEKGAPAWQAEQAVFGCCHSEVSVAAGLRWGFPEQLVDGLDYIEHVSSTAQTDPVSAMVAISSKIAMLATSGASKSDADAHTVPPVAAETLGIRPEQFGALFETGSRAIAASSHLHF